MAWFSNALGAVAGAAASSLFGKKGKNKTTSTTKTKLPDFNGLRKKAFKAGFNPLTALRYYGGGGGSTTTTTTTGGALSTHDFISNALGRGVEAGVNNWFNREQIALDNEVQRIQHDILREDLQRMREPIRITSEPITFGFDIPTITDRAATEQSPERIVNTGFGNAPVEIEPDVSKPATVHHRTSSGESIAGPTDLDWDTFPGWLTYELLGYLRKQYRGAFNRGDKTNPHPGEMLPP